MGKTADLLPGTLDMLILKAVSLRPLHGYGVLLRIRQISGDALDIPQGSLYPALYRLETQGLIAAEWGQSENGRRAKVLHRHGWRTPPPPPGDRRLESSGSRHRRSAGRDSRRGVTCGADCPRCGGPCAAGPSSKTLSPTRSGITSIATSPI